MDKPSRSKPVKDRIKAGQDRFGSERVRAPDQGFNRDDEVEGGRDGGEAAKQNGNAAGRRDDTEGKGRIMGWNSGPTAGDSLSGSESHPGDEVNGLLNAEGAFGLAAVKKKAPIWLQVLVNTIIPVMLITIGVLVISWLDTTHRIGVVQDRIEQAATERNEMKKQIRDLQRAVDDFNAKQGVVKEILKNSVVELKKK